MHSQWGSMYIIMFLILSSLSFSMHISPSDSLHADVQLTSDALAKFTGQGRYVPIQTDIVRLWLHNKDRLNGMGCSIIQGALARGADPNGCIYEENGRETPFLFAVASSYHYDAHTDAVMRSLIEHKANVNSCSYYGATPLGCVMLSPEKFVLAQHFVDNGAHVDRDFLLLRAMRVPHAFNYLLSCGTDLDMEVKSYIGITTPLVEAALSNYGLHAIYLLVLGADPTIECHVKTSREAAAMAGLRTMVGLEMKKLFTLSKAQLIAQLPAREKKELYDIYMKRMWYQKRQKTVDDGFVLACLGGTKRLKKVHRHVEEFLGKSNVNLAMEYADTSRLIPTAVAHILRCCDEDVKDDCE